MTAITEHAKIAARSSVQLANMLRLELPPYPHPGGKCGLGTCGLHIALEELLDRACEADVIRERGDTKK